MIPGEVGAAWHGRRWLAICRNAALPFPSVKQFGAQVACGESAAYSVASVGISASKWSITASAS
ncbi:MAG: hypothetical protein ABL881_12065, partial [Novosphingobium sp.]